MANAGTQDCRGRAGSSVNGVAPSAEGLSTRCRPSNLDGADHRVPVDGASARDLSAAARPSGPALSSPASYAPPTGLTPRTSLVFRDFDLLISIPDRTNAATAVLALWLMMRAGTSTQRAIGGCTPAAVQRCRHRCDPSAGGRCACPLVALMVRPRSPRRPFFLLRNPENQDSTGRVGTGHGAVSGASWKAMAAGTRRSQASGRSPEVCWCVPSSRRAAIQGARRDGRAVPRPTSLSHAGCSAYTA